MKNKMKYMPLMLLLFLSSCFDDKGNYDYVDIKDALVDIAEVTANKGQIVRDRYTDLVLKPEIQFNAGAIAAEYDFEWSLFLQQQLPDADNKYQPKKIIGTVQNLSYNLIESPDKYYVALKTTHKETKATIDYRFKLVINSMKGFVVYDESASGEGDLQVIRDNQIVPGLSVSQNGVEQNYFSVCNGGKKLNGVKFMSSRNMNNKYNHLFLYKADGFVKLNAGTFEIASEDYNSMFLTAPAVAAPMAHFYPSPSYGYVEALMNNNEVYVIRWSMMGQEEKFATPLSVFGTPNKYNPFIAPIPVNSTNTNRMVLYNDISSQTVKGQFVTINSNGAAGYPATTGAFSAQAINPDATTKLRLKYMGQGRDGITCAFFKDELNDDKPWLYVGDFRVAAAPLALSKYDLSGLTDIANAKLFTFGTRGDVMFYATNNNVYSYAFGGTPISILSTPGDQVIAMKLYTHSANEDHSGRILFVATYNGTSGKVYKIRFNELNGQLDGEVEEYTGFGKVVDMIVVE